MTRKSKKLCNDTDQEYQDALQNPDAVIQYNCDGSYNIEYEVSSPTQNQKEYYNDHSIIYNIYHQLTEYSSQQGLPFLDSGDINNLYNLIHEFIPDTR
uniref:Uncharacterized protein n=1 Tax=Marseillevirus LCMAC201 TaxID=2506605 RepID=A0A481YVR7_9VIRU|nr:MAG: hypothetical protein LCMAC201_01900 [Marseillevirus LCMAC201]